MLRDSLLPRQVLASGSGHVELDCYCKMSVSLTPKNLELLLDQRRGTNLESAKFRVRDAACSQDRIHNGPYRRINIVFDRISIRVPKHVLS